MSDILKVRHKGLYTSPNPFSAVPEGALLQADHCVIDADGILESRRGNDRLAAFTDGSHRASRYYSYQSKLLACYGATTDQWGGNLAYFDSGAWHPYSGTFNHPDNNLARLRFLEAAANLYFSTSTGVYKIDSYSGVPGLAGVPKALDLTGSITGTSGFFTNNPVVTVTGTTANLSNVLSALSSITGISVGQYVSGTGIPSGTTVSSITQEALVLEATGNTQAGTNSITSLSATSGLATGQVVVGNNIPSGTTVTAVHTASTVATTNTAFTAGSTSATPSSMTGIAVGQLVTNANVPANTYVQAVGSSTITLSQAATGTAAASSTQYQTPPSVDLSNSPTSSVTGAVYQFNSPASITLNAAATASGTGVSLTFSTGAQVAARVVWGIKDANQNVTLGAPSNRAIVINNSGLSCDVNWNITIPAGITTAHFFQLYRTAMSPGADIDPGDEPQLVYEGNPTSSDILAGSITVTDIVPDSLRGASLYTNASEQGISQSNERPPLSWDMANFRGYTFYGNVTSKQRLALTIVAAGSPSGVQSGDTLTIAGTTYTADSSETASTGHFKVSTSGTPAQNIADTALSLVRVINQYASNTSVYASYVSGVNDLPGMIVIEERGIGGSAFAATASAHGSAYSPILPTSGTSVESTNAHNQHYVQYSKAGQPEAVPLLNFYPVGSANDPILRILALRDSLIIFKQSEGIWQLTGFTPADFVIRQIDSSANLLAPDSAVILNNQIWCLCDQGITIVTETGTQVVSRPIEDLVLGAFGSSLSSVKYLSTGIAYQTDRKYILFTISGASDTTPTQAFVFNAFTTAFTRWPLSKTCGYVNRVDDKLYLGDALSSYTNVERKNRDYTDYADEAVTYNITNFDGTTVYLDSTNEIEVGDRLYQSAAVNSLIVDVQPGYVTVLDTLNGWTDGAASVYRGIDCQVEYAPVTGGNAALLKQLPEIAFLFRQLQFYTVTASFASDVSPAFEDVPLYGTSTGSWGLFGWGQIPWGGSSQPKPIPTYVPLEKQLSGQLRVKLRHRQAFGVWKLEGFDIPLTGDVSNVVGL